MKNLILKIFLISLCLNFASCQQNGEGQSGPSKETSAQNEQERPASKDEKDFAQRIKACRKDWNQLSGNSSSKDEDLVAMGIVGRECLKVEKTSSLKKILSFYELAKIDENVNWIEVSKTIIKMESL